MYVWWDMRIRVCERCMYAFEAAIDIRPFNNNDVDDDDDDDYINDVSDEAIYQNFSAHSFTFVLICCGVVAGSAFSFS